MQALSTLQKGFLPRAALGLGVLASAAAGSAGELQPRLIGQWPGFAQAVVVTNGLAYAAAGGDGLAILDVSNPATPAQLGSYETEGPAEDVAILGDRAFAAVDYVGLVILDVSDPANPVRLGGYDTQVGGYTGGVAVSGNLAFVAGEDAGLVIVDVSDPANPVRLGGYDAYAAWDVVLSGDRAFVAEGSGLVILDVSDPANPVRLGSYDSKGFAYGVAVSGDRAFVADRNGGLVILDVSDPTRPVRLGGYDTEGLTWHVAVSGDRAFVADGSAGLVILDVSDPANLVRIGGYDSMHFALNITVLGDLAFVAGSTPGLTVLALSPPPQIIEQPASQTVSAGASATFCVTASGEAPLSYQWQRDGEDIPGATEPCYTLPQAQLTDSGSRFRCLVSDAYESVTSEEAVLTVEAGASRPVLSIELSGEGVALSWPTAWADWILEEADRLTDDPSQTPWQAVSSSPLVVGERKTVVLPAETGQKFYRLRKP